MKFVSLLKGDSAEQHVQASAATLFAVQIEIR